jgi:molecular chaperone DnaK
VAVGASIQAGVLAGDVREVVLLDVTPLTVGVETLGSVMTPMVPRNTTIPTRKTETYTTAADSQTQVEIHVMQGERPMARDNRTLGKFILDGIPPAPRGVPQVEVTFDIDANGILHVTAKDKATSREQSIKITGASTLDKKEVDRLVKEAEAHASEDQTKREAAETRNRGDSVAFQVEKLLKDHGDSLSADDRKKVEDAVKELREALAGEDQERIKRAIDAAQEASYKLSEEMYKAAAAGQAGAGSGTGSQAAAGAPGTQSKPDDVIDAEYKPSN